MKKEIFSLILTTLFVVGFAQDHMKDITNHVKETGSYTAGAVGEKSVTIKAPEACWKWIGDDNHVASGSNWVAYQGRYLAAFAKYMGWSDVYDLSPSYGDTDMKKQIDGEVDGFKNKISLVLDAGDMPCTEENVKLMMRYGSTPGEFMEELLSYNSTWKPKGGEMHVKVVMSGKVDDINVTTDGKNFTVTAPWKGEPREWDTKIDNGLKKGGN